MAQLVHLGGSPNSPERDKGFSKSSHFLNELTTSRHVLLCLLMENHCMQQGISLLGSRKGYWHSPFETPVGCIGKAATDESTHLLNGFRTILQCQAAGLCHFHLKKCFSPPSQ